MYLVIYRVIANLPHHCAASRDSTLNVTVPDEPPDSSRLLSPNESVTAAAREMDVVSPPRARDSGSHGGRRPLSATI